MARSEPTSHGDRDRWGCLQSRSGVCSVKKEELFLPLLNPNSDPDLQSNIIIIGQVDQELRSEFFFFLVEIFTLLAFEIWCNIIGGRKICPWSFGSPYPTMFWEKSLQVYYRK